ncbi:MAG TPA: phage holin family protein [Gaiellaceae bacterium]|nr:phage holin family protein [Gaiellaceae bacterium]
MSPTQTNGGLGWAAKELFGRARSIAGLQAQLAQVEIKQKLTRLGIGAGLGAGAVVVLVYAIGFLFAGAAAALALALPLWASLLIVGGALLAIALLLVALAVRSVRSGAPPVPKAAIEEARLTSETVKSNAGG